MAMRILEAGHVYEFDNMDVDPKSSDDETQSITFLNREEGNEHAGIQTQDVIRAAIDRTKHCDNCLRWEGNDLIIYHLRMALALHEARAILRKVEKGQLKIEDCILDGDGHLSLNGVKDASREWTAYGREGAK